MHSIYKHPKAPQTWLERFWFWVRYGPVSPAKHHGKAERAVARLGEAAKVLETKQRPASVIMAGADN